MAFDVHDIMMIKFLPEHLPDPYAYTFAIIVCTFNGRWIWVRHKERVTWELPAGHVERGETVDQAAERELYEETGATNYLIQPVCSYQGLYQGRIVYGKIFQAEIRELSPLPDSEIAEITLESQIPKALTYPDIQPLFFRRVTGEPE